MHIELFILPLLALGAVVLICVFAFGKTKRALAVGRPRHRHPVTRVVCGLLALVLAGAVVVSSWKSAAPLARQNKDLLLLLSDEAYSRHATEAREREAPGQTSAPPKPQKLVFTALVAAEVGDALVLVDGASVVIDTETELSQHKTIQREIPGGSFEADIVVHTLETGYRGAWTARGHMRARHEFGSGSGSRSGGMDEIGELRTHVISGRLPHFQHRPLSVVPGVAADRLILITHIGAVAEGEPQTVPAAGWLQRFVAPIRREIREHDSYDSYTPQMPNGIAMLRYTGPASWLLLLAAVLVAQVFRHRGAAFVGAIVAAVLLAVAMDRAMVERHATVLADPATTPFERHQAISRINQTFFNAARAAAILKDQAR